MESGLSLQPDHKTNRSPRGMQVALQPGTMTGRRSETPGLKHLKISYIFSLPRISTKDFPYIKGKIDRSTGINYSSVNFEWAKDFL